MTRPIVIGVDLSLTGTGMASSQGWTDLIGMVGLTKLPLPERIEAEGSLLLRIQAEIRNWSGEWIMLELPAFSKSGGGTLERHALWWDLARWALGSNYRLVTVPPTNRAKYATGKGNAPKTQVIDAVARRFPDYETKGNENIADAIVLMAMGMDHLGYPLTPMPATHRVALDKIEWPK